MLNLLKSTIFNPLGTNFTKSSNTLEQFVGKLPTNCLGVFGHFVGLALKRLIYCRVGQSLLQTGRSITE